MGFVENAGKYEQINQKQRQDFRINHRHLFEWVLRLIEISMIFTSIPEHASERKRGKNTFQIDSEMAAQFSS